MNINIKKEDHFAVIVAIIGGIVFIITKPALAIVATIAWFIHKTDVAFQKVGPNASGPLLIYGVVKASIWAIRENLIFKPLSWMNYQLGNLQLWADGVIMNLGRKEPNTIFAFRMLGLISAIMFVPIIAHHLGAINLTILAFILLCRKWLRWNKILLPVVYAAAAIVFVGAMTSYVVVTPVQKIWNKWRQFSPREYFDESMESQEGMITIVVWAIIIIIIIVIGLIFGLILIAKNFLQGNSFGTCLSSSL